MTEKEIISKVLERLDDGTVISVIDDFLAGHCHEFAIALHRVLGYDLGLIKSTYTDKKTGDKKKVLLHAFGIDDSGKGFDREGRYDIQKNLQGYKSQKHPETGEVLKNISFNKYKDEKSFRKKLWTIPVSESWINKAMKKIAEDPLWFAYNKDSIKMKEPKTLNFNKVLELNEKFFPTYNPNLDFNFKNEFSKAFPNEEHKKILKNKIKKIKSKGKWKLDKWVSFNFPYISDPDENNKTDAKLKLDIGFENLQESFDFLKFKMKVNNNLSLNQSKNNFVKYMEDMGDFIQENAEDFIQEALGDRYKKALIAKVLKKLK